MSARFTARIDDHHLLVAALAGALVVALLWAGSPPPADAQATSIEAACPRTTLPPTDFVDEGATHGDSIRCLVWYELAQGRTATRFGTGDAVTRGQLASLIARTL
jgi:hypothetical protein